MASGTRWTGQELLAAFRLYSQTSFGRLHQYNPEIIELASRMGRTPSAVAMKACNFASLDPIMASRGIAGLGNVSRDDRELWDQFLAAPSQIAEEAEAAIELLMSKSVERNSLDDMQIPPGPSEYEATVRVRRLQSFFRAAVLSSYDSRCAISGIAVPALLIASHIIPWNVDEQRRADPRNGICLNALYDKALDRGLLTFDSELHVMLSPALHVSNLARAMLKCC